MQKNSGVSRLSHLFNKCCKFSNASIDEPSKLLGLADLPAEIWSEICKQVIPHGTAILINPVKQEDASDPRYWSGTRCKHRQPAITLVCRKFRDECLPHYYNANIFYADMYTTGYWYAAAFRWIQGIGILNLGRIKHLYITWSSADQKNYVTNSLWDMGFAKREVTEEDVEDATLLRSTGLSLLLSAKVPYQGLFKVSPKNVSA